MLGYFFALLIGLVMGITGGGGSILGVPVFAYLFHMDAVSATTASLWVVGVAAATGTVGHFQNGNVKVRTGLLFGIPSVLAVVFQRLVVLPYLPETLFEVAGFTVTKDAFILLLFAVLMLFSSVKMIWGKSPVEPRSGTPAIPKLILQGIILGLITGLVGAGGGFLIVPALVMFQNLEMKKAIGTSLFIIAMNSFLGFLSSPGIAKMEWNFLLLFSGLSVLGMFIGIQISRKINSSILKTVFGWFVLLMAFYILIKELFFN